MYSFGCIPFLVALVVILLPSASLMQFHHRLCVTVNQIFSGASIDRSANDANRVQQMRLRIVATLEFVAFAKETAHGYSTIASAGSC